MQPELREATVKKLFKEALVETLHEQRELLHGVFGRSAGGHGGRSGRPAGATNGKDYERRGLQGARGSGVRQ